MRSARKAVHFGGSIHTRALVRIAGLSRARSVGYLAAHHHQTMIAEEGRCGKCLAASAHGHDVLRRQP